MGNHYNGLVVTFEHEVSEDYAQRLMDAIRHLRGVADVQPVERDSVLSEQTVRTQVDVAWRKRILALLEENDERQ